MDFKSSNLKKTGLSIFLAFIKTNLYYLLTKRNVFLLIIVNLLSLFIIIINSSILKGMPYIDAFRNESNLYYETNVFQFIKFLYGIFVVFINISYFNNEYSSYASYLIKDYKTKIMFYLSKYIAVMLFDFLEFLALFYVKELVKIFTPFYRNPFSHFKEYISLFCLGLYAFIISSLLMITTKSHLSGIFALIVYWVSDLVVIDNSTTIGKIVSFLIISIDENGSYYYGSLHILFLFLALFLINISVLLYKDNI